jgi:LmbE family N-acetylglucosaminyl deacetylase
MKILVIAPHPDDEVLGCGGTIARHVQKGDQVDLCVVTKAYTPDWSAEFIKNRKNEIINSNKILGIKNTITLDLPTVKLDTLPQKDINKAIGEVVGRIRPDVVYLPHRGDLNSDHRLVFESALVAVRPIKHLVKRVLVYEIPSETEWGEPLAFFSPNAFVDITPFFGKKINAMKAYKSELRQPPHPRSLTKIEALARVRGAAGGLDMAEAFMMIREVTK